MQIEGKKIRLKELRKESKLTQEQLANYLKVDHTLIEKLCSLFGCTEDYLLGREDAYLPLNFAFRSNKIQAEDLESIAAVNKIVMNIRYMNEKMGD